MQATNKFKIFGQDLLLYDKTFTMKLVRRDRKFSCCWFI